MKEVVVYDSLCIGVQLEKEMQLMVDTYQCEWKEVVNSPELRARFSHFVNTEEPDPSLQFVPERGQKVPAAW